MVKHIDIKGQHFGSWTVLKRAPGVKRAHWYVRCVCGARKVCDGTSLRVGASTSCGCQAMYRAPKLAGQRFTRLVVLKRAPNDAKRQACWHVLCDCGTRRICAGVDLRSGHTKSCGCWGREVRAASVRTHGLSRTRTHRIWASMIQRCTNPKRERYPNYGGRGITVCARWRKFENFFADMGTAPLTRSIDRKDNNAGYTKNNCRWSTAKMQARNQRPRRKG